MSPSDVLVVGGGFAGASCALAATRLGLGVRLVYRAGPVAPLGECMSASAVELLRQLVGADLSHAMQPMTGRTSFWGEPVPSHHDALLDAHGAYQLVDRARLEKAALDSARRRGVSILETVIRCVSGRRSGWRVGTDAGPFEAMVLVDATGRAGVLAALAGRRRSRLDRLVATLGYAGGELPNRLVIESQRDAWWYRTPTPAGGVVVGRLAEGGARLSVGAWVDALRTTREIRQGLDGRLWTVGVRDASSHAMLDAPAGILPVGDAAIARDPLCGRGLEYALTSGIKAARLLSESSSWRACSRIWGEEIGTDWESYRHQRQLAYAQETRWRDAPLWATRAGGTGPEYPE